MFLHGNVRSLILLESDSYLWPYHFVGITKNGHALHFQHINQPKDDKLAPFWFEGNVIGIKKKIITRQTRISKRKIKYIVNNWFIIFSIMISIWIILFIPWTVAAMLYTPIWTVSWGFRAISR